MKTLKKFRIWHQTQFGIGVETRKAKDIDSLISSLPKRLKTSLLEIEEL